MAAIGIDLGKHKSCVGVWKNGKVEIIQNDYGDRLTSSYVAFTKAERLIGDAAKKQASINPENTIYNIKRIIGQKFDDERRRWSFKVFSEQGNNKIEVEYKRKKKSFSPEESSMVIGKMKAIAESYLGIQVKDAVISVPACFNDAQRQATKDAGTIAGLNGIRLISEPTAAALAYGLRNSLPGKQNILIYDMGGGYTDVSIIHVVKNSSFEVLSTFGDSHLGGKDFDQCFFLEEIREKHRLDLTGNKRAISRLQQKAEHAKKVLSTGPLALVEIDSLNGDIDYQTKISRQVFEHLCSELFYLSIGYVERALQAPE